ncbi:DUF72 domain-containing protein [Gracilinema caldarium]|uniref:DUF72 domain-containing protein n=1 Tax=Gracilinema caldarium (strain ATCC 51460 / DSM 7334 / H1) TaxID=744872 RepID=F8F3I0_GRAC1|nr:DUF72 domain-containing protein [Gracilinema caldarium]AEJ19556.1 protein of unknown function DUF72 [Gracilinema caldarium DSM 7334]
MGIVLTGTSGYSYHEWVGPVYPEGIQTHEYLSYYSTLFSAVELNFSYYRMPEREQMNRILEESQNRLIFSVKAHESLTHRADPLAWEEEAVRFCKALEPLAADGKLGTLLLQFPFSFHYEADQRRYLDRLLKTLKDFPVAVEFRNSQWFNNRVIEGFRQRSICLVSLDMPSLKGLPPLMDVVTAPFAYLRLHGRNGETWWGSDGAERYNYLYNDQELQSFVDRIRLLLTHAERVFVFFNNHRRGQAVQNGQSLVSLLKKAGLPCGTV